MSDSLGELLMAIHVHEHDERVHLSPQDDPVARAAIRLARAYAASVPVNPGGPAAES